MQLMVEGDKWEMYIPSDLAYGDRGSPPKIGGGRAEGRGGWRGWLHHGRALGPASSHGCSVFAGETLIFQMEIIKIKGGKVPALKCNAVTKAECNDKEQAYIDKSASLDGPAAKKELDRLSAMVKKPATPELTNWMERRIRILEQLVKSKAEL